MPINPPSQYAQPSDFSSIGVLPALAQSLTGAQITQALQNASVIMDTYIGQQFDLPLLEWDASLTQYCCWIARFTLLGVRGYNPNNPAEQSYYDMYKLALAWLKDVANGIATPQVTDSSPNATPGEHAPASRPNTVSPSPGNATWGTWSRQGG